MTHSALLAKYPKQRPNLPSRFQDIYATHYKENREGGSAASSIAQRMERWLHRSVAADLADGRPQRTLELGAGTLNQLDFESGNGGYDVVEPFEALYQSAENLSRVDTVFADIAQVPRRNRYDRITSIAALEHICNLPDMLARSALLLAEGGNFRAAIPSEGGFLWRMGWTLTTGLEFRLRHGLDYGVLMAHEHVNTAWEIETLVAAIFETCQVTSFGLGRQFSLYRFISAGKPRRDVALTWLNSDQEGTA